MKKILVGFLIMISIVSTANSQLWKLKRYEISAGLGTTQFYGDIGGFTPGKNLLGIKDLTFRNTNFCFSGNFKYRLREDVSLRLNLAFGYFHATDKVGSNDQRAFESKTFFVEPSIIGEYYFIKSERENDFAFQRGRRTFFKSILSLIDCYAFTGVGGLSYHVNPNNQLESYATKLSGFTAVIPLGVGVKYIYNTSFSFGLEWGTRYALSDNIDGYTSRYSKSNDVYHFLTANVTYRLSTGLKGGPKFRFR